MTGRTYWRLHVATGRVDLDAYDKPSTLLEFLVLLDGWNRQANGVWQYWRAL
jgi:hypothetical protein